MKMKICLACLKEDIDIIEEGDILEIVAEKECTQNNKCDARIVKSFKPDRKTKGRFDY